MATERWIVEPNTGGVLAERGLHFAVYDTEQRHNRYAAYTFEESMARKIAAMLNAED